MTHEQLEQFIQKIERHYRHHRWKLKLSLRFWLLLGYGVFLGSCLLLLGSGALAFFLGTIVPGDGSWVLLILGAILFALGVSTLVGLATAKTSPMEGFTVDRTTAPPLFEILDQLREELGSPPFDEVKLIREFSACVQQIPRLGVFGWSQYQLGFSANLLDVLTPQEIRAVLAHELAHFSRRHVSFGTHAYQVRRLWMELFQGIAEGKKFSDFPSMVKLFSWFLAWYLPRFNAYALVMSRQEEFEADHVAAQLAGREAIGSSLWKLGCFHQALQEKFWPAIWRQAATHPTPPEDVIFQLREFLQQPQDPVDQNRWTKTNCQEITDWFNTHPCFIDRIQHVGLCGEEYRREQFPSASAGPGLEYYLPHMGSDCLSALSRNWSDEAAREWNNQHRLAQAHLHATEKRKTLSFPKSAENPSDTTAGTQPVTGKAVESTEMWDEIMQSFREAGFAGTEEKLRAFVEQNPQHSFANLLLGQELVAQGNLEGTQYLQRILAGCEERLIPQAAELLADYYRREGNLEAMREVRLQVDRFDKHMEEARHAESNITPKDTFLPHALSSEQQTAVITRLEGDPELWSAWLVQKPIPHFPDRKVFLLAVQTEPRRFRGSSEEKDQLLVKRLTGQIHLPGRLLILSRSGTLARLAKAVLRLPGSLIFARDGSHLLSGK